MTPASTGSEQAAAQTAPTMTPEASPTSTATVGPPTAAPLVLGETSELTPLATDTELTITRIAMLSEQAGWAIGGSGDDQDRLLITQDGATTWREVTPPIRASLAESEYQVEAVFRSEDSAQIFRYQAGERGAPAGSDRLVVWSTDDGGASWEHSQPLRVPFLAVEGISPYWRYGSEETGWILARRGGAGMHQHPVALLHTEDGGLTWSIQHGPFDSPDQGLAGCTKSGMDFGSEKAGLLTISDCPLEAAEVLITTDGGANWRSELLPAPEGYEAEYEQAAGGGCSSHSPQVISDEVFRLAVLCRLFEDGDETRFSFLYASEDAGASWQTSTLPEGQLVFLSPDEGWLLGRQIFRTGDGGQSWELRKEVFWDGQFSFLNMNQGWAVAQSEDGELALVRTSDGAQTWEIIEPVVQ